MTKTFEKRTICFSLCLFMFLSTSTYVFPKTGTNSPIGSVEIVSLGAVSGWAYDADAGAEPIYVCIYINDAYFGKTLANGYRPNIHEVLPEVLGDYHGYDFPLTGLTPGIYNVKAYAIDYPDETEILLPCASPCNQTLVVDKGMVYLENGIVKVGVNLDWGGAISEISCQGVNLINNHDNGRQVQIGLFDGNDILTYDPQNLMSPTLGYSPNQGGDKYDHYSSVITYTLSEDSIYVKTCPLEWNPDNKGGGSSQGIPSDVYLEQWISLDGQKIKVDYKVTHFGSDNHAAINQLIPYLHINLGFDRLITYENSNPWKGDDLIEKSVPVFPESLNLQPTEYWASFVDNTGFGLTLYSVSHYPSWGVQRFATSPGANLLTPTIQSDIPNNKIIKTSIYIIVGNYLDARDIIYSLKGNENPVTTSWEFNVDDDSECWVPWNQLSSFLVSGGSMKTSSSGTDPQMLMNSALDIDASLYRNIELRMKASAGNVASIYFTTIADKEWNENKVKNFNIISGSTYVNYNLDMGALSTWTGRISQLRFDPSDIDGDIEIDYIRLIQTVNAIADNCTLNYFLLSQNYPNPFSNTTEIKYTIPESNQVKLTVFNLMGKEIADLINEYQSIGSYTVTFSHPNLPNGIYFYSINCGAFSETKKMIVLR